MWIYKKDKLGDSGCYDMNFLYNSGKFYFMDNHKAAAWCWSQKIDPSETCNFFHIDKHYDLLDNLSIETISMFRKELTGSVFNDYHQAHEPEEELPLVRFD